MQTRLIILAICLLGLAAFAVEKTDFSGTWDFNTEKSKNIGMMAQMKMSLTIQQSDAALDITGQHSPAAIFPECQHVVFVQRHGPFAGSETLTNAITKASSNPGAASLASLHVVAASKLC